MTRQLIAALSTALWMIAGTLAADAGTRADSDWPQVRGPARDGVGSGHGLARTWPAEGPRQVWRQTIGAGFSAVAVRDGRLYTQAAEDEKESVICLDAASGELLWKTPIGSRFASEFGDGPRATPTLEGDLVFAASGDAHLAALNAADGGALWKLDLPARFGGEVPRFGYSVSPLVDGELLIIEVGGSEGKPAVVALDKRTGEQRWGALEGPASYSSPVVADFGGVRQYLVSRRAGEELVALATDGAVLWRHPGARASIVLPLVVGDDRIFLSSVEDDYGGVLLRVARDAGGAWQVEELWSNRRMRNYFNNAVVAGGHLYGFDNATFRSLDLADGTMRWSHRGFGKGSLVAAGDLLFVLGDTGSLALVQATPDAFTELGRVQATTGRSWTAPALAGGTLYVRDHDELVAYDATATAKTDQHAQAIIDRYLEARGGGARWRAVERLAFRGFYAAFSQRHPFTLRRARPDHYRIDLVMLGSEAIRAKDADGLWWQQPKLGVEAPARLDSGPLVIQHEREAIFGPALLDATSRGITVTDQGEGEVEGTNVVVLEVRFADGATERWHLDAASHREVMIESQVHDFTQGMEPMTQRAYYSDFRNVDGLVIPHHVELEFGARLEVIEIESVDIDPAFGADAFTMPAQPPEGKS